MTAGSPAGVRTTTSKRPRGRRPSRSAMRSASGSTVGSGRASGASGMTRHGSAHVPTFDPVPRRALWCSPMSAREDFDEPFLNATLLLADSAQVADGRLFILGGGLGEIGPGPQPMAIAMLLDVPWDQANAPHDWKF